MKKRFLVSLLLCLCTIFCVIGLVACNGDIEKQEEPIHTHIYIDSTVNPTCTKKGYTLHKCSCGDEYIDNYVNATGHAYSEQVIKPTCTEKGYTKHTCSCGDEYIDNYVNATEHAYSEQVIKPTCTEKGYTKHTCSCGDEYIDNYVNAKGHSFSTEWVADDTYHWHTATCEHTSEIKDEATHMASEWIVDSYASYESKGNKHKECTVCKKVLETAEIPVLIKDEITFKTLSVDDNLNVYGKVPNNQTVFSFINEVKVSGNATFVVSTDIYGLQQIPSKTVPLAIGDNTFYITETVGNDIRLFTVTVRRKPIYTVTFNANGGTTVENQTVEEDSFATEPTTTRTGYTFVSWDYDFTKPITGNLIVNAKFKISDEMSVFEFVVNDNSCIITGIRNTSVTNVVIPNYVTNIDDWVFEYCNDLEYNEFDNGMYLGNNDNPYLVLIKVKDIYATDFNINKNTKIIYSGAFRNSRIISIEIPNSVSQIGKLAFRWCKDLKSVKISDNVEYIEGNLFEGCKNLESVIMGKKVKSIENKLFYECQFLTSVNIPDSITSIGDYAFYKCTSLTIVNIPDSVKSIGMCSFFGCSSIESLSIGNGVTNIGYRAFCACSKIKSLIIGKNVEFLGQEAFANCIGLEDIILESQSIGELVFCRCSSLKSVVIGSGVIRIEPGDFMFCSKLDSITFSDATNWYRTTNLVNWQNGTGGTYTSVTTPSTNATYFKDTYYNYYWYKLDD